MAPQSRYRKADRYRNQNRVRDSIRVPYVARAVKDLHVCVQGCDQEIRPNVKRNLLNPGNQTIISPSPLKIVGADNTALCYQERPLCTQI